MKREWKETKLASAARAVMGQSPPSSSYNETGDGLPFFQGKADFTSFHPSPSKWCTQPLRLAKKNDILMSVRAPVGDVNMSMESCCIGRGLAALSCNPGTNPYFLYFLLGSLKAEIEKRGTGTTFLSINKNVLEQLEIHLPSLPEQKKIAAVLLKIQRAIETQDRMIQSLRDLKKSTMQHLFTHGLRGEKTKMTDFGLIPENWRVELLEECSTVQTGVAKGRKISDHELLELPYLRVANVQDGHLDLTEMKTIRLRQSERSRYSLQDGDVVLTEGGDFDKLGRGFVWEGQIPNCVHQNHVFAVRVDRKLLRPHFLAYLVQSQYGKAYFLKVAHKTTNLACINTTKLKRMPVPIPEKAEQDEIVDGINAVDQQVAGHESQKTALQDLFKTVLNKLMTGELRVAGLDVDVKEVGV